MTDTTPAPFTMQPAHVCGDCLMLAANGEAPPEDSLKWWHPDPETRERYRYNRPPTADEIETARAEWERAATCPPGWELVPGCPGCEWCRECPTCGACEAEHPETDPELHDLETDGPYCPGPVGGWAEVGIGTAERADYCPSDEGEFRWSPCDLCGWPPGVSGGNLYAAGYLYDPRQDPRRDPDEARRH